MRIAFVWDWEVEYEYGYTWLDGLAAALKILSQKHELKLFEQYRMSRFFASAPVTSSSYNSPLAYIGVG